VVILSRCPNFGGEWNILPSLSPLLLKAGLHGIGIGSNLILGLRRGFVLGICGILDHDCPELLFFTGIISAGVSSSGTHPVYPNFLSMSADC
jgi:hypothetical protein